VQYGVRFDPQRGREGRRILRVLLGTRGLKPPRRDCGVEAGFLAQAETVAGRPAVRLYRHNAVAKATMVSPATMIAHGSAPRRSNHCV